MSNARRKHRVMLHGQERGFITVDAGATIGAIVGVNLFDDQGNVLTLADLRGPTSTEPPAIPEEVYWISLQEIPPNVVEVEHLAGAGYVHRDEDGEWTTRTAGRRVFDFVFSFGDQDVFLVTEAFVVGKVTIAIDTPFNGADPTIEFGTDVDPDLLMPASGNDPTVAESYESTPNLHLSAGTTLRLSVDPGAGGTQGAGTVLLQIYLDTDDV